MEDIQRLFEQRTDLLRNGPILYRGDPDLPALVSSELTDFVAKGVPEALLRATVDTFIQTVNEERQQIDGEYMRAYNLLVEDIHQSHEYKAYMKSPSRLRYQALLEAFLQRAPEKTILKASNIKKWHHEDLFKQEFTTISAEDLQELEIKVRELMSIQSDIPDVQEAVVAVQNVLNSVNSLPIAWLLVIAFTPEDIVFRIDGQPFYEYDRTLTALLYTGLTTLLPFDTTSNAYALWASQVFSYTAAQRPQYLNLIKCVIAPAAWELIHGIVPDDAKDVVELAGEAFAALCTVYTTEAMQQMILPRLAHMYIHGLYPQQQPLDMPFRNWAWSILPDLAKSSTGVFENVARWIYTTKKLAHQWAAPATVLSPFIGLIYTTCAALYEILDRLVDIVVYGFDKFAGPFATWLKEYLYIGRAWASVVLPGARRRPKSVWALLFVNDFTRLDPGTRFALSCRTMQEAVPPGFLQWQETMQSSINQTGLGDYELFPTDPIRPLRMPNNPWTIDEEILKLTPLFQGQSRKTDIMDEKLLKWAQYNVPQGIDGQWFATPERVAASIRRYDIDRVEPDSYTTGLFRETAHALAEKYPEMYKNHKYFTVNHAMRRLKWDTNMSPGLGFIGNVRTRKMLRKHGFLDAIQKVAEKRLIEGFHPGSVAHVFVKEQVVSLEKLLKGKNIRTVTAMDLLSNTLALPFSIELSRAPPPEAYVLNALPRSEGGYRPFFDALKRHATVVQADAHQFDSQLGPVVSVEGLAELRSIGFQDNPAINTIKSQIRAHYVHMRHAKLVDLTTGTVFDKTGGFMTGQVNTSYDNRDSVRLVIVAGWSHATGRPASEFWDHNTFGNAGDDDAWGSDDDIDTINKILDWIKTATGVTFEIEQQGWDQLSLTALEPTPEQQATAYYRYQLGMPSVTYGIRTEPAKLLLTKTEFKARQARLSDIPFRQAHVDSMVGTAYLTAYNPEIYQDLADLYKDDISYVLLRFYSDVRVEESRDKFGNLSSLVLSPGRIRPRYARVADKIDKMITSWLNKVKWPSYQRVFNIWVKPYDENTSNIAKHYRTLTSNGPALPVATKLLYGLVGFRESLYMIPNHVVRALPEFPGADLSVTLKTPEFIIERFVWASLYHQKGAVPTREGFRNRLREGPYASAASPVDFLEHLETAGYMKELIKTDLEELRAQAIAVTLVYSFLEIILNKAAQTPLLGIPISLYALATRDVNRLYATANHVYWLSEGRSSSVISNLMPADPYAWLKQMAVILATGLPSRYIVIPGLRHLVKWAPALVEAWTMASATVAPNVGRYTFKEPPVNSPWAAVIDSILALAGQDKPFDATVQAPTGSGKSTLFVALLQSVFPARKIWLLHPTKAARDEYINDFLPESFSQILTRGVTMRQDAKVYSVTYGYFVQIISQVLQSDIVLFDEVHLSTTEMWVAYWAAFGQIRITMTATPKFELQPKTGNHIVYPGSRRFKMKMTYVSMTFDQLWLKLQKDRPELLTRALIICPTLARVNWVRNTIARLSFASSELSSDNPIPEPTGIIVATSIADQALTINPPPTTVIDLGTMMKITVISVVGELFPRINAETVPVSQEVADQRAGRGGRANDCEGFGLVVGPRTPHEAPQRFPTTVFLSDAVVDSVMLSLGLRNALSPLNECTGLLRYIRVAQHIAAIQQTHNLRACAVALLYLSAGTDFEIFVNDLLNYQTRDFKSDALRVYDSQAEDMFPELQIMHADHATVRILLENALFECVAANQAHPVAAFLFVDGWLTPVGSSPAVLFTGAPAKMFPSTVAPASYRGMNQREWNVYLNTLAVRGVVQPTPLEFADPLVMALFTEQTLQPINQVGPEVVMLLNRVSTAMNRSRWYRRLVYFDFGEIEPGSTMLNLRLSPTGVVHPLRNTETIDVSDVGLYIGSLLPLLIVIAAALNDDQLLVAGQVQPELTAAIGFKTDRLIVWGPPENIISVVISPFTARRAFAAASWSLTDGSVMSILQMIPFIIASSLEDLASWQRLAGTFVSGSIIGRKLLLN